MNETSTAARDELKGVSSSTAFSRLGTPAHQAGVLPRPVGFRPTSALKLITMGLLASTGNGVAIFALDWPKFDLFFPTFFLEFAS